MTTTLLRPPLAHRSDVFVYVFPGDGSVDPDAAAAEVAADLRAHEFTRFFAPSAPAPPVVRVVPTSEAAVYREAAALVCQRLAPRHEAAPVEAEPGVIELRTAAGPARRTVRVVQALGS